MKKNVSSGQSVNVVALDSGSTVAVSAVSGAVSVTGSAVTVSAGELTTHQFFTRSIPSADTAAHALAAQAVKEPVVLIVDPNALGTVTVSDGTNGGPVLSARDRLVISCRNLSEITYQFSINAASEKFGIAVGI